MLSRARRTQTTLIALCTLAVACSAPLPKKKANADAGAPSPDVAASAAPSGGGANPAVTPPGGSGSSGGSGGGGEINPSLVAEAGAFRNAGRRGDTLIVTLKGTDPAKRTSAARLRFSDQDGQPVRVLDTNWDGTLTDSDSASQTYHFDTSTLGAASFDATITIAPPAPFDTVVTGSVLGAVDRVKHVHIALEDETGARSPEIEATIDVQTVKVLGESCDVKLLASRCSVGLSCSGSPSVCGEGSAPSLSNLSYLTGASPKMAFRGGEADEDISHVDVEFLDAAEHSIAVVTSGEPGSEGTTEDQIRLDARAGTQGATFFVDAFPLPSFTTQVPKIAVRAYDLAGRSSERVVVPIGKVVNAASSPMKIGSMTSKPTGQSCDPDGFDACVSGTQCSPGIRGITNTCKGTSTVRADKLRVFPTVYTRHGDVRLYGSVAGSSSFDPPVGCVPGDTKGRPEATVAIRVDAAMPTLTISTALPETNFDTAVYVIPKSDLTSQNALGCNDDAVGYASTLTLTNVPVGDYIVVVESINMRGGRFSVTIGK